MNFIANGIAVLSCCCCAVVYSLRMVRIVCTEGDAFPVLLLGANVVRLADKTAAVIRLRITHSWRAEFHIREVDKTN